MENPRDRGGSWVSRKAFLAVALAVASILLPRAEWLNTFSPGGMLSAKSYAIMLCIFISAFVMARLDPVNRRRWAFVIGLAPLVDLGWSVSDGAGNLWPIAIGFALFLGLVPSFLGARLASAFERRPGERRSGGAT